MGSIIVAVALMNLLLFVSGSEAFHSCNLQTGLQSQKRRLQLHLNPKVKSSTDSCSFVASPASSSSDISSSSSRANKMERIYGSSTTIIGMSGVAAATTSSVFTRMGIFRILNSFFKNYPYISSFLSTGVKALLADLAAQATESGSKKDFDFLRNLTFFLYGGLYQGCAQYFLYNVLFPKLFGVGTDSVSVAKKVLADLLILTPFLCLPSVYFLKAIVFRYSFKEAARRYWVDVKEQKVVLKYWMLWAPVQTLTFGFIPPHLRILFIAGVSFFWLIILSKLSSKSDS